MQKTCYITTTDFDLDELDGKTFQLHRIAGSAFVLYPVEIMQNMPFVSPARCPVIINGDRCGHPAGHDGKHAWGSGD